MAAFAKELLTIVMFGVRPTTSYCQPFLFGRDSGYFAHYEVGLVGHPGLFGTRRGQGRGTTTSRATRAPRPPTILLERLQ